MQSRQAGERTFEECKLRVLLRLHQQVGNAGVKTWQDLVRALRMRSFTACFSSTGLICLAAYDRTLCNQETALIRFSTLCLSLVTISVIYRHHVVATPYIRMFSICSVLTIASLHSLVYYPSLHLSMLFHANIVVVSDLSGLLSRCVWICLGQ